MKNNPKKAVRSVGDGEVVEFDVVVGEKGNEAANVTGPNGEPVKGSPYAADKRRGYRQWFYPRRGGGGGMRPRRPREDAEGWCNFALCCIHMSPVKIHVFCRASKEHLILIISHVNLF